MPQFTPDYMGPDRQSPPVSGLAVASMCCGIVSLVLICAWPIAVPLAIAAVVLGLMARGKIRRGEATGARMAKAGINCGIIPVMLFSSVVIAGICVGFRNLHL